MWNLKYGTNEHTYKTETDPQTQRTDMWLPRGMERKKRDGLRVWGSIRKQNSVTLDKKKKTYCDNSILIIFILVT